MGRVLIVDEEPMLRLLLRLVLENEGHEVRDADNGRDALIGISAWHPDVVVTELALPELSGPELIKRMRMRAESVDMRIVVTSASLPADVDVDALFAKPYEAQLVAKEIDSLLGSISPDKADEILVRAAAPVDGTRRSRTAILGEIWSKLVSVDTQVRFCDVECDVALEEILRLARFVDERTRAIEETARRTAPDPDLPSEMLGL